MLQTRGVIMLTLLVIQFVTGMILDMFIDLPDVHPGVYGSLVDGYDWALSGGGGFALTAHVVVATILVLGAIAALGFAILARHKVWIIAASFGLLATVAAFLNGLIFIGTNKDEHSLAMAFTFMVALIAYGAGLYFAKIPKDH